MTLPDLIFPDQELRRESERRVTRLHPVVMEAQVCRYVITEMDAGSFIQKNYNNLLLFPLFRNLDLSLSFQKDTKIIQQKLLTSQLLEI
jgi:hypothetical protein